MVMIEISGCGECSQCKSSRHYTSDSFETCFEFKCSSADKRIAILDWNEGKNPKVPEWCPKRKGK